MIDALRDKHPEYSDMSDKELINSIREKHYSDMPPEQFYKELGARSPIRPAVVHNGKEYIGRAGQTHDDIVDAHSIPAAHDRGFALPDGTLVTRAGAYEFVKDHQPEVYQKLQAAGVDELHSQDYLEAARDMIKGNLQPDRPTHEEITGGTVVNAEKSLALQDKAPDLKPVVKGTNQEVLTMKRSGLVRTDKTIFIAPNNTAYIIDLNAVKGIYGGSVSQALQQAKKDLLKGGDSESKLLGYPNREGISPENTIDVAVTDNGEVVTDIDQMKQHAENGNISYAAEGEPGQALNMAREISKRWKELE